MIIKFIGKYFFLIVFFLIWELASRVELVNPIFVPPFSEVIKEVYKMVEKGEFFRNLAISSFRAISGFSAALLLGIFLGFLLGGWFPLIGGALQGLLEVCSQVNPFLLIHIILIFMQVGEASKIVIITWTCIWPIIFSTISGIQNIDQEILKLGKSFGLNRINMFIKVVLPGILPSVFTGIRLSAGYSFVMLIAAEMMGANSGLGYFILNSQMNFRIKEMYAAVLLIALLALVLDCGLEGAERKLNRFRN